MVWARILTGLNHLLSPRDHDRRRRSLAAIPGTQFGREVSSVCGSDRGRCPPPEVTAYRRVTYRIQPNSVCPQNVPARGATACPVREGFSVCAATRAPAPRNGPRRQSIEPGRRAGVDPHPTLSRLRIGRSGTGGEIAAWPALARSEGALVGHETGSTSILSATLPPPPSWDGDSWSMQ